MNFLRKSLAKKQQFIVVAFYVFTVFFMCVLFVFYVFFLALRSARFIVVRNAFATIGLGKYK